MSESKGNIDGSSVPVNPPPYPSVPSPTMYPQQPDANPQQPGAYPPQPGSHGQPVHQVLVTTTVMAPPMGPNSTQTTCGVCHKRIMTRTESNANSKTHLIALVLCLLGCWCCCCIPYCSDSCMSTEHYCPSCNTFLGSYQS